MYAHVNRFLYLYIFHKRANIRNLGLVAVNEQQYFTRSFNVFDFSSIYVPIYVP